MKLAKKNINKFEDNHFRTKGVCTILVLGDDHKIL